MGSWNGTLIGLDVEAKDKKLAKQFLKCLEADPDGELYEEIGVLDYRNFRPAISGVLEEDQLLENEMEFWHGSNDYSDEYGYEDEEYEDEEEQDDEDEDEESEGSFQIDDIYHLANKLFAPACVYVAHEDGNSIDDTFFRYEAVLDPKTKVKTELCCFYSYGNGINVDGEDPKEDGTERREDSIGDKELSADAIDLLIEKAVSMKYKELAEKLKAISKELSKTANQDLLQIDNKLFKVKNGKLVKYKGKEHIVTIPEGVICIEKEAFYRHEDLEEVIIPEGVTTIKDYAFGGCSGLTKVSLPESLTTLGDSVFYECSSLTKISIPKGVKKIGSETFADMEKLEEITIPEGITVIKSYLLSSCTELKKVTLPQSLTTIENGAFNDCESLVSITIPERVTSIGENAFSGCKQLMSIIIPDRVTKIADHLFSECYNLAEICLPEKISDIGESAFFECKKLTEFTWPQNITEIKNSVFCSSGLAHFIIPTTVTKIGESAFQWCELKEISIPESVTDIQVMSFKGTENLAVIVTKGSYGEQYCKKCKLMENIYKSIPYADFKELFKLTSEYFDDNAYRNRVLNYLVFYPPYYDSIEPARDVFEVEDYRKFKKCLSERASTSLDEEGFAIAMKRIKEIRIVAENDYEEVVGDPSKVRYILNKTE